MAQRNSHVLEKDIENVLLEELENSDTDSSDSEIRELEDSEDDGVVSDDRKWNLGQDVVISALERRIEKDRHIVSYVVGVFVPNTDWECVQTVKKIVCKITENCKHKETENCIF